MAVILNQQGGDFFDMMDDTPSTAIKQEKPSVKQQNNINRPNQIDKASAWANKSKENQNNHINKAPINKEFNDALTNITSNIDVELENPTSTEDKQYVTVVEEREVDRKLKGLLNVNAPTITSLIKDNNVRKLLIQNYKTIFIETDAGKERLDTSFSSEDALNKEIAELSKECAEVCFRSSSYGELLLSGGVRLIYAYTPFSSAGTTASLIFPQKDFANRKDFLQQEVLKKEMLYFLERCIRAGINILVSGNVRSERIEFLNLLNGFISEDESVVAVDSRKELLFSHDNVCKLDSINYKEESTGLTPLQIATHMQPDRITINELNAENIVDFLYLDSMGCHGNTASIYANSAKSLCTHTIPLLYKTHMNTSKDLEFLSSQIAESLQLIVHLSDTHSKGCKVMTITHADGLTSDGMVNVKDIFIWNKNKEIFEFTGYVPKKLLQLIKGKGLAFNDEIFVTEQAK